MKSGGGGREGRKHGRVGFRCPCPAKSGLGPCAARWSTGKRLHRSGGGDELQTINFWSVFQWDPHISLMWRMRRISSPGLDMRGAGQSVRLRPV